MPLSINPIDHLEVDIYTRLRMLVLKRHEKYSGHGLYRRRAAIRIALAELRLVLI